MNRVYTVGRQKLPLRFGQHVDRRIAERSAPRFARHNHARHRISSAQCRRGRFQFASGDGGSNASAADGLSVARFYRSHDIYSKAALGAKLPKRLDITGASASKAMIVTDEELGHAATIAQQQVDKLFRRVIRQRRVQRSTAT